MALTNKIQAIADAIRQKAGTTDKLTLADMATAIENIPSGSSEETYIRSDSSYNLTSNVTEIGDYAFYYNNKYVNADFPKAKSIGDYAFGYNGCLKTGSFPLVESIGDYAFRECKVLATLTLQKLQTCGNCSIYYDAALSQFSAPLATTFGNYAFCCCTSLTSIDLPQATTFGDGAFLTCSSLPSIDLPQATTFGKKAFSKCTSLTSIDLPQATTFGDSAFSESTKLEKIVLEKVENIDPYYLCNGCSALTAFVIKNENAVCSLATSVSGMFGSTPIKSGTGYIYVPDSLVDSYKTATGWSTFAAQIKPLSELPSE